jgi:hypothetical protein
MRKSNDTKQLRQFGLVVGGIFAAIGLWPVLVRAERPRFWALAVGGALMVFGLVLPRSLTHVRRGWMAAGEALGWINARVLLSVVFYGLVTPIGIVRRRTGRDRMRCGFEPGATTYRVAKPLRPSAHMTHQF